MNKNKKVEDLGINAFNEQPFSELLKQYKFLSVKLSQYGDRIAEEYADIKRQRVSEATLLDAQQDILFAMLGQEISGFQDVRTLLDAWHADTIAQIATEDVTLADRLILKLRNSIPEIESSVLKSLE